MPSVALSRLGLAAWALAVSLPGAAAQDRPEPVDLTRPLALQDAVKIALANQPSLKIAESQVESARARVTQSMSGYYPKVTPRADYTNSRSRFRTGAGPVVNKVDETSVEVSLRQLIFDTGKREESVRGSRSSLEASGHDYRDARQDVILNVTTAFYELRRRLELVRVAEASVERAKTTLDFVKAAVEQETTPKKDIFQAEADYQNALVNRIGAQNDARLAQTSLKNAMGIRTPVALVTADNKAEPEVLPQENRSQADLMAQAFARRLDLKRDESNLKTSRSNLKVSQINAGVQVEADFTETYRFDPNRGENRSFITTFSYPLFDAGLRRADVRQSRAQLNQQAQQLELTRQRIQLDVDQAFLLMDEARARVPASRSALEAARVNYEAATAAQKEGAGDIIDVITAQTQLVTAETNAVQAIYDYLIADARLKRSVGENDPASAGGKAS